MSQLQSQASEFLAALPAADRNPLTIGGKLVDFLVPQLDEWVHVLGGIDAVIASVHAAYDQFVVPLDLPGIPGLVEPMVDSAAKRLIATLLRAAHDRLHKE